jgi:catechol 2,3-dioxygenase-like lactoylglutathione lyase family enzyme
VVPSLRGIHHLKLPVSDLDRSVAFWEDAFAARRVAELDHVDDDGRRYACILDVPGLGTRLELRLDPSWAAATDGRDPVTLAVDDRAALVAWRRHLSDLDVPHSGEIASLRAWITVVEDPDGTRLRLYTLEQHGPEIPAEIDDPWLVHVPRRVDEAGGRSPEH